MVGGGDGGQRIELVVHAGQLPFHAGHLAAALQHGKGVGRLRR
jgi:hypothetical protein